MNALDAGVDVESERETRQHECVYKKYTKDYIVYSKTQCRFYLTALAAAAAAAFTTTTTTTKHACMD